ncbi:DUF3466 family protein [Photobacterium damselae subsp. damselae]|uniref:DUF3466 family protein n=1 Tax=Photobacterium damselae TaxID=38293 RepID=UPI000A2FD711|nr:DUF3466 family protein [Photobacterium damselae]ARR49290.1 hypothetical protein CAY62_06685 [Photobacterium damselae subsp. damselae]QAY36160.1 DUF3466 family protein [Photobacterium damselae subsp. damselae]
MQHKMLKLSTLAVLIAGVTQAQAAVYKVVEVATADNLDSATNTAYYPNHDHSGSTEQFKNNAVEFYAQGIAQDGTVVGNSRFGNDGINYSDVVAFHMDNYQRINDYNELYRYCRENLGFNTCDVWAEMRYFGKNYNRNDAKDGTGFGGLRTEQAAWWKSYYANALPFVFVPENNEYLKTFANSTFGYSDVDLKELGTIVDNVVDSGASTESNHVTTNAMVLGALNNNIVYGVTSSAYFDNDSRFARTFAKRGFVNNLSASTSTELNPIGDNALVTKMGQSVANHAVKLPNGNLLVVGSASYVPSNYDERDNKYENINSDKLPDYDDIAGGNVDNASSADFNVDVLKQCTTNPNETIYNKWACQFTSYANKAAFWVVKAGDISVKGHSVKGQELANSDLNSLDPDDNDRSFQGNAKSVALVNGKPVAVGYSTDYVRNDYYANRAAVFTPKSDMDANNPKADDWSIKFIPGTEINDGSDRKLSYSMATAINANGKVAGVAKNFNSEDRSYAERMFIYDNASNQTKFLTSSVNSLFFNGSNGYLSSINDANKAVGWVDIEKVNQVDGRERRQRAFLYNDGQADGALKANGAWLVDDLTNGGAESAHNNQYRIARATGINKNGQIAATALKCTSDGVTPKQYSDTSPLAQCDGYEVLTAVRLDPIAGGTIVPRKDIEEPVKRSGGSLGVLALTVLGFIGFRRRK